MLIHCLGGVMLKVCRSFYNIINQNNMGSVIESKKAKCSSKHPHRIKPKGDRLGWTLRSEVKYPPLREIVGEGRIVSDSCCFISTTTKMIM